MFCKAGERAMNTYVGTVNIAKAFLQLSRYHCLVVCENDLMGFGSPLSSLLEVLARNVSNP